MWLQILITTCALLTIGGRVSAEPQLLDGPGPHDWDCVADGGRFLLAYAHAVSEHLKVTGIMHVLTMHVNRYDQYGAAATVQFNTQHLEEEGLAFQLEVLPAHRDTIAFVLRSDVGWKTVTTIASQPNKESEIPFMLTLDKGIVTVTAASSGLVSSSGVPEKISATSKKPISEMWRVALSCSGAHVRFSNVVVSTEP